jgi:predicted N-acetyltransferase YhbS
MDSGLERCDAEHAPAFLESSNPVNVPYYERFGFEAIGELAIPRGGPVMTPMWRQARV